MWLCTKYGFFSIVKKGAPETWQVRARVAADLENLILAAQLENKIIPTPEGDYCCRIVVDQAQLAAIMRLMAESIDYSNFKDCIARLPGQKKKLHAYHNFWGDMFRLQNGG